MRETVTECGRSQGEAQRRLSEALAAHMPGFRSVDLYSDEAEIIIHHLDRHCGLEEMIALDARENAFKVFIVHEINQYNAAYLKVADFILFLSPYQKRVCEDVLGLRYPSEVLPPPHDPIGMEAGADGCFLYFEDPFRAGNAAYFLECLANVQSISFRDSPTSFHAMLSIDDGQEDAFQEFRDNLPFTVGLPIEFHNRELLGSEGIAHILSGCRCGEYFRQEISKSQFDTLVAGRNFEILCRDFAYPPIIATLRKSGIRLYDIYPGLTKALVDSPLPAQDARQWAETAVRSILEYKQSTESKRRLARTRPEPDRFQDLDIVLGKPLSNRYVFSICYRNQAEKITRCLESVLSQDKGLDIGIAVVDDASDDGSAELVRAIFSMSGFDHVLVENRERKFASRNFYNLGRHLIADPETVVIELDGDDFLAHGEVVSILDRYYRRGFLKTCGSFTVFPGGESQGAFETRMHAKVDVERPWSLGRCNSWLPLRSCKARLLREVGIEYYLNRKTNQWLTSRHDSSIHSRLIELARGKTAYIAEKLYMYDLSGEAHDHGVEQNLEKESQHLRLYGHLDELYHVYSLD